DVGVQPDCRAAVRYAATRYADTDSVLIGDGLSSRLRSVLVAVHAHNVRALLSQPQRYLAPDAGGRADNCNNLPRKLLLRWHALEFGLFKEPVLDVESFLQR